MLLIMFPLLTGVCKASCGRGVSDNFLRRSFVATDSVYISNRRVIFCQPGKQKGMWVNIPTLFFAFFL